MVFVSYVAENKNMMSDAEGSYHSYLIFNNMYNLLCILSLLGYLRVVLCLSVKRAFEQTHCYKNSPMCSFSCKPNSFSLEKIELYYWLVQGNVKTTE